MDGKCEDCIYWEMIGEVTEGKRYFLGRCRKKVPRVVVMIVSETFGGPPKSAPTTMWPQTKDWEVCGEFKLKEKTDDLAK